MSDFIPTSYYLQSVNTKELFTDQGWTLDPPSETEASLVRAVYSTKNFSPLEREDIYRYANWLPISRTLKGSSRPITYKSSALAEHLKLNNLYITFSGFYPQIGANFQTCSFKETEAYSVCARLDKSQNQVLVVASAGNTARAFARVCSDNNIPLLLCVPEDNLNALWFADPINPCVRLFATQSGSDYFDAIHLSNMVCQHEGFLAEGGAKNIARRDGMGTTFLSCAEKMGRIPDYYFQAIGSGTGAIAAYEANLRLIEDGRFGTNLAKLILSQNAPFLPMHNAWQKKERHLPEYEDTMARKHAEIILAKVLSNRKPPYSLHGGVFDVLSETNGDTIAIDNDELLKARDLFCELEKIDIYSAAAVAVASLIKYREQITDSDAFIMLNITGGGEQLFRQTHKTECLKADHIFPINPTEAEVKQALEKHFSY